MSLVKQAVSLYLVVTALAVAALLMVTPLIHDGSPGYPLWKVLNWFMAAGVLVVLLCNFVRKRGDDGDLGVSIVFYLSIVLTMLFFWEWFWTLNPDSETGEAVTSHMVYFPLVDAIYTVTALVTARWLWRTASEG